MPIFLLSLLTVVCFCQCAFSEDMPRSEENSALFIAIEKGDYDAVQRLIHAKVNVNDRGNRDKSPLHFAAAKGDARIVRLLLDAGADIGARAFVGVTFHGGTPLHMAARANHVEIIKLLLQAGTDVNIRSGKNQVDTIGYTPLHSACEAGRFEAAECLIQAGADVNMKETETGDELTPLILAVQEGHLNIVKLLLDNNADVNLSTKYGIYPIDFAAGFRSEEGSFEIVSLLVEHKAKLDLKVTPLICVQGKDTSKIYSFLVKSGATTGVPFLDAVLLGDAAKIDALLKGGAKINVREKYTGNTALHFAVKARNAGIAEMLIHKGIDINAKNREQDPFTGDTPLHIAVKNKDIALAKLLIDSKADVNVTDADKCTPLHVAIDEDKSDDIAELLIKAHADVNAKPYSYSCTPLSSAVLNLRPKIVKLLIEAKADVNSLSWEETPLDIILSRSSSNPTALSIQKMLLDAGAKTSEDLKAGK